MQKDQYFFVYNAFTNFNNEYKLNPEELYVYSYLSTLRTRRDKVYTTFDMLSDLIKLNVKKSQNMKKIKDLLQSLRDKKVIEYNDVEKNNEMLVISFCDNIEGGFEKIYCDEFDSFTDVYDYYVYVCVKRQKSKKVEFTISQWEALLEVSRKTVIKKLEAAVEKKIVLKREGQYTSREVRSGQRGQETNIYYLPEANVGAVETQKTKKDDVKKTPSKTYKTAQKTSQDNCSKNVKESQHQTGDLNKNNFSFDTGNWFDYEAWLTVDDCIIYLQATERNNEESKLFVEHCEKRIEKIKKKPKGKKIIEELLKKAQQHIEEYERRLEHQRLLAESIMPSLIEDIEDCEKSVNDNLPRHNPVDISAFADDEEDSKSVDNDLFQSTYEDENESVDDWAVEKIRALKDRLPESRVKWPVFDAGDNDFFTKRNNPFENVSLDKIHVAV
jgi:hypothetical protein